MLIPSALRRFPGLYGRHASSAPSCSCSPMGQFVGITAESWDRYLSRSTGGVAVGDLAYIVEKYLLPPLEATCVLCTAPHA
ncbi:hypothetical protein M404DRAFT_1001619 [Pisolithus tinctorius Marx 270]|uniref:Uncharacterized protein n=1 Tax=Pisolithus tinctorius Marx 270 TaxID=870435 RepID=A0A0C3J1N3_PISTI|nr:hypothetical protein M404DRAFT_1001619 [Pisolithus tinctorius Marx 270]